MSTVMDRPELQCEASPACREPATHLATTRHVPALHVCIDHARRLFADGWRVKKLEPA